MDYARDPDNLECFYICQGTKRLYTNFNLSVELNRKTDAVQLSNVLRAMVLKTPYLSCNVFRNGNFNDRKCNGSNFKLNYLKKIEFEAVVSFEKFVNIDNDFFTLLTERVFPMGQQLPLWQLVVFENPDTQILSFYCDHTFFDGTSGVLFMKDLVKGLNEYWKSPNLSYVPVLFDYEKDAPNLGKIPLSGFSGLSLYKVSIFKAIRITLDELCMPSFAKKFFRTFIKGGPNMYRNPVFVSGCLSEPETKTLIRAVSLTKDLAGPLLRLCKANKVTFTPLLAMLALYSFQQTVKKKLSKTNTSSSICIDINGRRYLPECANRYGLFMSTSMSLVPPIPPPREWFDKHSPLRKTNKTLNKHIASRFPFKFVGVLKYVNPWFLADKQLGLTDLKTMDCSNVGVQDISCGDWYASSAWFSQSVGNLVNMGVSCISVEGVINTCFGFAAPLVDLVGEETIDAFEDHFLVTVQDLIETGSA